jgi:excinuclease UvrABC ATPase subunit
MREFINSAMNEIISEENKNKLRSLIINHNKTKKYKSENDNITILTTEYKAQEKCPICENSKFQTLRIYKISNNKKLVDLSDIELHMLLEHTNYISSTLTFNSMKIIDTLISIINSI